MTYQIGDKVLRKSGRQYANYATPGVVERLSGASQVYVRWEGNYHSLISVKNLLPYTLEAQEARLAQIRAARKAARIAREEGTVAA